MDEIQPSEGGTKRDYANMINEHTGNKKKPKKKGFSPWVKMGKKKGGSHGY